MRRFLNPKNQRKSKEEQDVEVASTLERIVKDKEVVKKRLEEEEKEFLNRKRQRERELIEMEKQEVARRQQEVEEKKIELEEHKRKNLLIQDKVQEQMKTLQMKLEEYRVNHRASEAELEKEISALNTVIAEVDSSLSARIEAFGEDVLAPSAPNLTPSMSLSQQDFDNVRGEEGESLYPTLPAGSMPRSISMGMVHHETPKHVKTASLTDRLSGSLGSSPQISLNSDTCSSRSLTPVDTSSHTHNRII